MSDTIRLLNSVSAAWFDATVSVLGQSTVLILFVALVHPDAEPSNASSPAGAMPKIKPGDAVMIAVLGTLPDAPIQDLYRVEPSGKVPLGPHYGRVAIAGLTFEEAEQAITRHLSAILQNPVVQVTDGQWELERRNSTSASPL